MQKVDISILKTTILVFKKILKFETWYLTLKIVISIV
jgi:hypothetical protein